MKNVTENVFNYGAVGDGETDDTSAVQTALNKNDNLMNDYT